jgi:hypothetical protein
MRKQIYATQSIKEAPISMKEADSAVGGQSWLYVNPTTKEMDSILKEFNVIPFVRMLIGENEEIVIAHGWAWTHYDMCKQAGKPERYYTHYFINLMTNKIQLGGYTLNLRNGYLEATKRLADTFSRLMKLEVVDYSTELEEWGEYTGLKVKDILSMKGVH